MKGKHGSFFFFLLPPRNSTFRNLGKNMSYHRTFTNHSDRLFALGTFIFVIGLLQLIFIISASSADNDFLYFKSTKSHNASISPLKTSKNKKVISFSSFKFYKPKINEFNDTEVLKYLVKFDFSSISVS